MIVGFTGTQVGMSDRQYRCFHSFIMQLHRRKLFSGFRHGDCIGSDATAHAIVASIVPVDWIWIHPPINERKRAFCDSPHILPAKDYIPRNHDIVDASHIMVATPETMDEQRRSGTWATVRYARKRQKPLLILNPAFGIHSYENFETLFGPIF